MGFIRFVLIGILVFIVLRFLSRLIAELRSFLSHPQGVHGRAREPSEVGRDSRDIKDAKFEDVKKDNENEGTPQ